MTYPKITVITPNYNHGSFIEETILSVLGQGYPNLEYIVIDGGSSDNSLQVIEKYKRELTFWVSEPDKGIYDAIQKGFQRSTGEIMTWINSDDILSKFSLFTVAEIFNDFPFVKWLSGTPNLIDERGRNIETHGVPKWNKYRYLNLDFKYIQQEGTFWRRNLWEKSGGRVETNLKLAGDLELWSRFFQHEELYHIPGILGSFRIRKNNQKSLDFAEEYNAEAIEILNKMTSSVEEKHNLNREKSTLQKFLRSRPFRPFVKFVNYNIDPNINKYPPALVYNRVKQRFIFL